MDGNCETVARPVGDVLCGTLMLLPGATALDTSLGEGAPKGKAARYAFGCGAGFRFTRLIVPEKVKRGRPPDISLPRRKTSDPPARETSPHSIISPSRAASRKSQAKLVVTAGPSSSWVAI